MTDYTMLEASGRMSAASPPSDDHTRSSVRDKGEELLAGECLKMASTCYCTWAGLARRGDSERIVPFAYWRKQTGRQTELELEAVLLALLALSACSVLLLVAAAVRLAQESYWLRLT